MPFVIKLKHGGHKNIYDMSITQPFCTTVSESGIISLPPEFYGEQVDVTVCKKPSSSLSVDRDEFWEKKPLEEIDAEQGGPKICTNPDEYFGFLSEFWGSQDEVEEFLRKRREEP